MERPQRMIWLANKQAVLADRTASGALRSNRVFRISKRGANEASIARDVVTNADASVSTRRAGQRSDRNQA